MMSKEKKQLQRIFNKTLLDPSQGTPTSILLAEIGCQYNRKCQDYVYDKNDFERMDIISKRDHIY